MKFKHVVIIPAMLGILFSCSGFKYVPFAETLVGVPKGECPGIEMAATCGNGTCDAHRLEDANTCPQDCGSSLVFNNLKNIECAQVQKYVEPDSLAALQAAVTDAVEAGQRIRIVGSKHSYNKVICGDGTTISTVNFDDIIGMDGDIVRVQAGVKIGQLADYLHERDLSVGFAHIGFRGITVAGSIGTSAHGSSVTESSVLVDRVVSLKVLDASGAIKSYRKDDTDSDQWRALISSLGLLGIVTEVGIQTEPQFNLDASATVVPEADMLADNGIKTLSEGCDFFLMNWLTDSDEVIRWCGVKTQETESANGSVAENGRTGLLNGLETSIPNIAREISQLSVCHEKASRYFGKQARNRLIKNGEPQTFIKTVNGKDRLAGSALGYSHRMISGNYSIPGGPYGDPSKTLYTSDWQITIPEKHMQAALRYINERLINGDPDAEPSRYNRLNRSLPPIGMLIRFSRVTDTALLSLNGASGDFEEGKLAMFIEVPSPLPHGFPADELAAHEAFFVNTIKGVIENYGGRAHMGKAGFDLIRHYVEQGSMDENLAAFKSVVEKMDPNGVFHADIADVLGVSAPGVRKPVLLHNR